MWLVPIDAMEGTEQGKKMELDFKCQYMSTGFEICSIKSGS